MQTVRCALALAPLKADNNNAAKIAMMAMTTNNSMRVKPMLLLQRGRIVRLLE